MTVIVGTALLVVGAAACGDDDGDDGPEAVTPELTSSTPPPTLARPTAPSAGPTDQLKEIKATGRLSEPVPGCLVIEGPGGRWELTGLPTGFGPGDEVSAIGRLLPDRESRCGFPVIRVVEVGRGS